VAKHCGWVRFGLVVGLAVTLAGPLVAQEAGATNGADATTGSSQPTGGPLRLDGHATLTVGTLTLNEGADFKLLRSDGAWVTGPLRRVGQGGPTLGDGSVVLLAPQTGKTSMQLVQQGSRSGAVMLIVTEDPSTRQSSSVAGSRTEPPVGLKGDAPGRLPSVVAVSPATMQKLLAQTDGQSAVLAVHPQQQTTPK
jgi:hypothetical protein